MPTRLVLLCAGATAATRAARFADPAEPLDAGGRAKAQALVLAGPAADRCRVSPAAAAGETAALIGVAAEVDPALRDIDAGDWTGRGLDALDPAALAAWLAAPEAGAPGGETMAAVRDRVGAWLDALGEERVLAISHAAVLRAAIAHALDVPVAATMAIDIAPLSVVVLSRHGRWRLQELRAG